MTDEQRFDLEITSFVSAEEEPMQCLLLCRDVSLLGHLLPKEARLVTYVNGSTAIILSFYLRMVHPALSSPLELVSQDPCAVYQSKHLKQNDKVTAKCSKEH